LRSSLNGAGADTFHRRHPDHVVEGGSFAGQHLRLLIANENRDGREQRAQVVVSLGHEVIARDIHVEPSHRSA